MLPNRILIAILLVLLGVMAITGGGCGGDTGRADELASESESLRVSATDKFRQTTAVVDGLVATADRGMAVPADQTEAVVGLADDNLESALVDLTRRENALAEAGELELDENYRQYISLMSSSNEKLNGAIEVRMRMIGLVGEEPLRLAGWDEIRAREIVAESKQMQTEEAILFNEAERLRNQAEQIRADNPGDFGDY